MKAPLHPAFVSLILSLLAACGGGSSSGGGGSGDGIPPMFAGATAAFALSDASIEVSWAPAMDNVDPASALIYNVYASQISGAQDLMTPDLTSAAGSTTEIVTGLLPAANYFFIVRAMDTSGNEDTNLIEVSDTTFPDTTDPIWGGGTSAIATSLTEIDLTWNAATDNQAMQSQLVYNIYSATVSGGQNFLAPDFMTPPGILTHTFTGLTPDTDYFFVVRAQDPSGNEDTNLMEASARTFGIVSFATQVQPIFTINCVVCHGPPFPAQGQDLSNYTTIDSTAINVPANETMLTSMLDRIEPFDSTLSYLIHKIDGTHLDPAVQGSGLQMPRLRPPLPLADRDLIRAWINQGAQNN